MRKTVILIVAAVCTQAGSQTTEDEKSEGPYVLRAGTDVTQDATRLMFARGYHWFDGDAAIVVIPRYALRENYAVDRDGRLVVLDNCPPASSSETPGWFEQRELAHWKWTDAQAETMRAKTLYGVLQGRDGVSCCLVRFSGLELARSRGGRDGGAYRRLVWPSGTGRFACGKLAAGLAGAGVPKDTATQLANALPGDFRESR